MNKQLSTQIIFSGFTFPMGHGTLCLMRLSLKYQVRNLRRFFKRPLLTVDHYTAFFTPVPDRCNFFWCDFFKVISFFTVDFKTFRAVIS